MKRLPLLLSLLALIALSVSIAYWVLQLYQPAQRPLAPPPPAVVPEPGIEVAATLFGGQPITAVASNYQLTGVVSDGRYGVAIIVADGAAPKALRIGREVAPGVTVTEVHPRYVMLSEAGVPRRIDLPTDTRPVTSATAAAPRQMPAQQPPQEEEPPPPASPAQVPPPSATMPGGPPPGQVPMPPPTRNMNTPPQSQ